MIVAGIILTMLVVLFIVVYNDFEFLSFASGMLLCLSFLLIIVSILTNTTIKKSSKKGFHIWKETKVINNKVVDSTFYVIEKK